MHAMRKHSISITQLASFSFNLPDFRLKRLAVLCLYQKVEKLMLSHLCLFKCYAKVLIHTPAICLQRYSFSAEYLSYPISFLLYVILFQLFIKGWRTYSEQSCRLPFVPVRLFQCLYNTLLLYLIINQREV